MGAPPSWLRRLAVLNAAATLGLIAAGGLVTSTGSGMAFPDWPTSGGHNLFLYPWLRAARAQFIEHGHRLAGAVVGGLTLALAFGLWAKETRRWVKELGLLAAAAVLLQGLLGGQRVLRNEAGIAFFHACLAHAFFPLTVALATVISPVWLEARPVPGARGLHRLCTATALVLYVQAVIGASVRHLGHSLHLHLALAALATALVCWTVMRINRDHLDLPAIAKPALWLAGLILFQAALGAVSWLSLRTGAEGAVLHATAHVVTGAATLGTATLLALRTRRWLKEAA